jgi:hypothetical protein
MATRGLKFPTQGIRWHGWRMEVQRDGGEWSFFDDTEGASN